MLADVPLLAPLRVLTLLEWLTVSPAKPTRALSSSSEPAAEKTSSSSDASFRVFSSRFCPSSASFTLFSGDFTAGSGDDAMFARGLNSSNSNGPSGSCGEVHLVGRLRLALHLNHLKAFRRLVD